jgi:exopolysaccharide biosynthesis polyprenyl glycosylphosphotransferase
MNRPTGVKITMILLDVLLMGAALFAALTVRLGHLPENTTSRELFIAFVPVFAAWIAIFYVNGLYLVEDWSSAANLLRKLAQNLIGCGVVAAILFYLTRGPALAPKTILLLTIVFFGLAAWCSRALLGLLTATLWRKRRIAFIGFNEDTRALTDWIQLHPARGLEVVAVHSTSPETAPVGIEVITDFARITAGVMSGAIDDLVINDSLHDDPQQGAAVFRLLSFPVRLLRFTNLYEETLRRVPLGSINDFWFIENMGQVSANPYDQIKRTIDVILALVALIVTLPFWPLFAAMIKIDSCGPVYFRQQRVGKGGTEFQIIKFRTMWNLPHGFAPTRENDERITRIGRLFRMLRIDELPQLLNVLRGDMSLVGPRPERPELVNHLETEIPYYRQRMMIRPGLTGWDQVCGEYHSAAVADTYKKLQFDLFYIKNRSLFLDLTILLKTAQTIVSRSGR